MTNQGRNDYPLLRWNWQTFTVAYWEESVDGQHGWIAATLEGFIAAQGRTKAEARTALIRTICGQLVVAPEQLLRGSVPADLRYHFCERTETFVFCASNGDVAQMGEPQPFKLQDAASNAVVPTTHADADDGNQQRRGLRGDR